MATIIEFNWARPDGELTEGDIAQLVRSDRVWETPPLTNNIEGEWNAVTESYQFIFDITNINLYDPTKVMSIYTGQGGSGTEVVKDLNLGDIATANNLATHEANTATAHNVTGAVVGTTKEQTLTNKTMDFNPGDLNPNLPSNFPANSMMEGDTSDDNTYHPAVVIKPTADDAILVIEDSDDTGAGYVEIQAANVDMNADRNLKLICEEVILADKDGQPIQLSGLAAGAANGDAVRWDEFNTLDGRVSDLETGTAWGGAPTITTQIFRVGGRGFRVNFDAGEGYRAAVARFEIYWSSNALLGVTAGETSTATLTYLAANANKIVIRGGEGTSVFINSNENFISVVAVAFDSDAVDYNSDIENVGGPGDNNPPRRDVDGNEVDDGLYKRVIMAPISDAAAASDQVATAFIDWLQATSVAKIKRYGVYKNDINDVTMRVSFHGKTSDGSGYLKVRILELATTTELASATYNIQSTSYSGTPDILEINLAQVGGLSAGVVYDLDVQIWNAASDQTSVRQSLIIEVLSTLPNQ